MKRFNMLDENFKCENCGYEVDKLNYTARDHCPNCLYSKHVDIFPGDRKNECHGLMKPIGIEKYKCLKCNQTHKNIMADDDNYDLIIKLSVSEI